MSNSLEKALAAAGLAGEGVGFGLKVVSATEARLGGVGGAERLIFSGGGAVQVEFGSEEIRRILAAVAAMERQMKSPNAKLLAALDTADRQLGLARRKSQRLTVTVPLATHAVELTPYSPEVRPE
jgi:hypothetical protein